MTSEVGTRTSQAQSGKREAVTESSGTLGFQLKRAEQALIARKANAVRALDLTEPQCKVLGFLADGSAKSCTQLSREALVTSQTMTGIVKNLEAKGLVQRHASPDHGRVMLVSLTEAGAERAAAASDLAQSVEASLREGMTTKDYDLLLGLLRRVAEVAPELVLEP
ncbi:MarR family winged helix-turn-helix transcriptional regulator [Nonomuraea aridisoli]|uniref:MarR family transcriptional regulator n=1 Tax=Nonomuraea aridisoli TaxID=2070368 RepID=A0A2W2D3D0_9ACTN|nr:MarR family winged helix-turn-helix transcriptional regulator [Nonomuraea aridisoli]PZG06582.1 MarR family transcriptional regulator [Nonomuraea aridisoli]